ncbi:MAG TPA: spore gernimation protein GerPD [Candidatus Udaeobacter sp.]|jgi:spore germination protein PD|nr:spore gernimation protein GerPD [Candidatus Udaeobacter sp.]
MFNFSVINHQLSVGQIEILGISSASMLQVGDTDTVSLYSMFDTPPESVIVGPMAPLPMPEEAEDISSDG